MACSKGWIHTGEVRALASSVSFEYFVKLALFNVILKKEEERENRSLTFSKRKPKQQVLRIKATVCFLLVGGEENVRTFFVGTQREQKRNT